MKIKIDTPEEFFNSIPTELNKNLVFRENLHNVLIKDTGLQDTFLKMCVECPEISFNSMFWTFNPRMDAGYRRHPFILRPKQVEGVQELTRSVQAKNDLLFDKSRDEGASEIICGYIANKLMFDPEFYCVIASKTEELVDDAAVEIKDGRLFGPHIPLFHKIMYKLVHLPVWVFERFRIDQWEKKFKFLQNPIINSSVQGFATSQNLGAGGRASVVFVDELGQVEPNIAQTIIDTVHDVSDVCVYNSTHGPWGAGHPYAKMITQSKIKVVVLDWSENPVKSAGLYTSPEKNILEILDIDYYKKRWPKVFKDIKNEQQIKLDEYEKIFIENKIRFIADGGVSTFNAPRSPWLDKEIVDRERSTTYIARYIFRMPQASADQVFDYETLEHVKNLYIRKPDLIGDISFDSIKVNERLTLENIRFAPGGTKSRLKLWAKLEKNRLCQQHNYIVACDISRGTGSSNSTVQIFDVNTGEQVGEWADAYMDVTDFAEQVIAICKWVGGASDIPFLIWEANGPGDTFSKRIIKYGYVKVYMRTDEVGKVRKRTKKYGWWSTAGVNGTKLALLNHLDAALNESVKDKRNFFSLIIHSESSRKELMDYMFGESQMDATISTSFDESTGAKFAHGDRVIPLGLICIAVKEQPKAIIRDIKKPKPGTFGYRFNEWKKEEEDRDHKRRRFRF